MLIGIKFEIGLFQNYFLKFKLQVKARKKRVEKLACS